MAGGTGNALSVAEAKDRLRRTMEESLPSGYVRRHPYAVLALAFAAGLYFGSGSSNRQLITRAMLKFL